MATMNRTPTWPPPPSPHIACDPFFVVFSAVAPRRPCECAAVVERRELSAPPFPAIHHHPSSWTPIFDAAPLSLFHFFLLCNSNAACALSCSLQHIRLLCVKLNILFGLEGFALLDVLCDEPRARARQAANRRATSARVQIALDGSRAPA